MFLVFVEQLHKIVFEMHNQDFVQSGLIFEQLKRFCRPTLQSQAQVKLHLVKS